MDGSSCHTVAGYKSFSRQALKIWSHIWWTKQFGNSRGQNNLEILRNIASHRILKYDTLDELKYIHTYIHTLYFI